MKGKKIIALMLMLAMLFTLAPVAFAASGAYSGGAKTYYVDSKFGNDHFNGLSPLTPFKTLEKAFDRKFNPGTTVLFRSGRTYQGGIKSTNAYIESSGTKSAPITLGSYGSGSKPVISTNADEDILWITGSYVNVSGLDFTAPNGRGLKI